jgi:nicotinamide mononucleotide adenylyltransferase
MVDSWEVERDGYTRTLYVLEAIDQRLKPIFAGENKNNNNNDVVVPRTVLVCGGDVLESMAVPGVWDQSLLEELLSKHGVACVVRPGVHVGRVLEKPGTLVHEYRDNVMLVENDDELSKDVSSTVVREQVRKCKGDEKGMESVESMLPNRKVMEYIRQHRLYMNE